MTINVAVCDDNESVVNQIERLLGEVSQNLNVNFELNNFFSGEALCAKLESKANYDLIFLDIGLPEISGIEVAKIIREKLNDERTSIVYISSVQGHSMKLFSTRPLDFLIKPVTPEKIEDVVRNYLKASGSKNDVFVYKSKNMTHRIPHCNIMYFENFNREVIIYKSNGETDIFYESLRKVYERHLKTHDFLPIHDMYVVNYDFVESFGHTKLRLLNGKELEISQSKRAHIRKMVVEIGARRN